MTAQDTSHPQIPGYGAHLDAYRNGRHVRVVNFHNTPHSARSSLRAELRGLVDRFRIITLDELDGFYETGSWADERPGFIPVFFEGYRNNAEVAGPVCDELGISAWFLICTGFVECAVGEQEGFALSHNIELVAEDIGRGALAMTWDQVAELSQRHTVTPHTASHEGIAEVVTDDDLLREVIEPKRRMDGVTGQDSPAMAWLWGSPAGGSPRHDAAIAEAGYRYVVSNTMIQRMR